MKIEFNKLDHLMICYPIGKDLEAKRFYTDILGFEEVPDPGYQLPAGATWYKLGDIEIHIRAEENHQPSNRHPAFLISNLTKAKQWLEHQGVYIKEERKLPGRNRFSLKDPFGNMMELIEIESDISGQKMPN